ncbi:MAG: peptide-methionine (S)-S-oxide reductase MsrA [bacterium]
MTIPRIFLAFLMVSLVSACAAEADPSSSSTTADQPDATQPDATTATYSKVGYFAGGCFWCVEKDFEKLNGVGDVISGYTGGDLQNPTYEQISHEETGHREAVKVPYDPAIVSYRQLVDYHLRHIDVTDAGGQFCDRGFSYMTAIWVQNDEERKIASEAVAAAEKELGQKIVTPILPAKQFWPAEARHQNYYKTHPIKYGYYRKACGRDARVAELWGKDQH